MTHTTRTLLTAPGMLALSILSAAPAHAKTTADVVNYFIGIESTFVGICIGAYDNGSIATRCAGETVLGNGTAPDPETTLFRIGSVSKTFAATDLAIANQRDPGLLDADLSTVAGPFVDWVPPGIMSLRNLADESSGLAKNWPSPYDVVAKVDDNFTPFLECTTGTIPGCWAGTGTPSYSNAGYGVLGAIVARHLGYPNQWYAATLNTVLSPLAMNHTIVYEPSTAAELAAYGATGYTEYTGPGSYYVAHPPGGFFGGEGDDAAGGVWSTAHDMNIWLQYNMGVRAGVLRRSPMRATCSTGPTPATPLAVPPATPVLPDSRGKPPRSAAARR